MNVSEIKAAALRNMNEKADEQTLLEMGEELLSYINYGYMNAVATKLKPTKAVSCESVGGKIPIEQVGEDFYGISRITDQYGIERRFFINNDYIFIDDGSYDIEYIYMPTLLEKDDDIPIIPIAYHYILSDYAAYRMFLKGSKARQARGEVFLTSYLNGLGSIRGAENKSIKNKYGSGAIG